MFMFLHNSSFPVTFFIFFLYVFSISAHMIIPCFYPLGKQYIKNTEHIFHELLFTPFSVTRFAMHRIYANHINSRSMARVFCDLRSQKTPRGILPVNSNFPVLHPTTILSTHFMFFLPAGCTSLGERISVWAAAEEG